jgi:aquaporin Z
MRAMPIRVFGPAGPLAQMKASFRRNWKHYLQEALGLAVFMVSACFFSVLLFSEKGAWHNAVHSDVWKNMVMGSLMGATALFIFYSPWTAPSGSQINPAVTLTFLRLDKMCRYDAMFFVVFQFAGGTISVCLMQIVLGNQLIAPPVSSAVTIPGKTGIAWAAFTELIIAFITMSIVLFSANHLRWKKYTRVFSSILVCCWVIFAGPVSGFGMNPARSFASALPSGIWSSFWIYLFMPFAGMLLAAEFFLLVQKKKAL